MKKDLFKKKGKFIIFKYSPRCGISHQAEEVVKQYQGPYEVVWVHALEEPEFKMEIAEKYGVKHESPQILFIDNQKCVEHFSHYDITLERLNKLS